MNLGHFLGIFPICIAALIALAYPTDSQANAELDLITTIWKCSTDCSKTHQKSPGGGDYKDKKFNTSYSSCASTEGQAEGDAADACEQDKPSLPRGRAWLSRFSSSSNEKCSNTGTPCTIDDDSIPFTTEPIVF